MDYLHEIIKYKECAKTNLISFKLLLIKFIVLHIF